MLGALYLTQQAALYPLAVGIVTGSPGSWEALKNMTLSCEHTGEKGLQSSYNTFALTFLLSCIELAGDLQ